MVQYPLKFSVTAELESGISKNWSSRDNESRTIPVAIPPEFEGPGGGCSPEDFFALALLNCFAATFKVIAERSQLNFKSLRLEGVLTVDRDPQGKPWMAQFDMGVTLVSPSDRSRAERLLKKTSESCLIHQSVKTAISTRYEITDEM